MDDRGFEAFESPFSSAVVGLACAGLIVPSSTPENATFEARFTSQPARAETIAHLTDECELHWDVRARADGGNDNSIESGREMLSFLRVPKPARVAGHP